MRALRLLAFALAAVTVAVAARARAAPGLTNDPCGAPSVVGAVPFSTTVSTTEATTELSDPLQTCTFGGSNRNTNSVWYSFTAPSNGTVTADTEGSDYDSVLTGYTGTCAALTEIACNDDVAFPDVTSQVSFTAAAGVTYLLEATHSFLDPGGGGTLHFALTFTAFAPASTPTPTAPAAMPTRTATPTPTLLSGDANCDGRRTAADLTALVILISADNHAPCGLDDANGDGILNTDDILEVIEAIFES